MGQAHVFRHAVLAGIVSFPAIAAADNSDTANKSNNPLNLAPGLNLQDYYTPDVADTNVHTNDLLLRGTLPLAPGYFVGVPQLLRATLPVSTRPDPHGGYSTGPGDLNLFDPNGPSTTKAMACPASRCLPG